MASCTFNAVPYVQELQEMPLNISIHPSLEIKQRANRDRGIFVKDNIASGTVLVKVPCSSLFCLDTLIEDNIYGLRSIVADAVTLREDDVLAIALLHERFARSADDPSKWAAHITILPRKRIHNAINLSNDAVSQLQGSSLFAIVRQLQQQVLSDFTELSASPIQIAGTPLSKYDWWSVENYEWALTQIHSRFISVPTGRGTELRKAMAPYFDLFNHSCQDPPMVTHGFVKDRPDGQNARGKCRASDETGALVILAQQALVAGDEIFLNYGPLGNLRLLQLYGFALPDNPYDSLDVWVTMEPEAPHYAIKQEAMARLGLCPPFLLTKKAPVVSPSLLAAVRIQRARDSADLKCLESALKGPLSSCNEKEALNALHMALTAMRGQLDMRGGRKRMGLVETKQALGKVAMEGKRPLEPGEEEGNHAAIRMLAPGREDGDEEAEVVRLILESEYELLGRGLETVRRLRGTLEIQNGIEDKNTCDR